MEDWVLRGLARWPNVPALFGWLGLDRRGRWLIKGEVISRLQIIDTINRNYAADEAGRWYFQNGPQRGYVNLEVAPLVLHAPESGETLLTHTELAVTRPEAAYLDAEGSVLLATEHGPGLIASADLDWLMQRLAKGGEPLTADQLEAALALPSGADTGLNLHLCGQSLPLLRLDFSEAPAKLKFVRDPQSSNAV